MISFSLISFLSYLVISFKILIELIEEKIFETKNYIVQV